MDKSSNNQAKITFGLFAVYFVVLIWMILFKMQFSFSTLPHFRGLNLIPFAGSVTHDSRLNYIDAVLNFAVFIPFGLYLSMMKGSWPSWKKIMLIAGVSLLVELLQYLFEIGGTDITDLLSNTLGGAAGVGIYRMLSKILKEKTTATLNILALVGTIFVITAGVLVSRVVTYRF